MCIRDRAVIDKAQNNLNELSAQVHSLKNILSNKQLRGAFGEVQLENLIRDSLPQNAYKFQHTLKNGFRVDCMVNLPYPPGPICIDSKFPLEHYRSYVAARDENEKKDYLDLMNMDDPVLNKIIFEGYKMLGLKTFFTAGPNEIRAWTIKNGFTAPNAAGVIHSDFERGFIKAEVIDFDDYIKNGGELGSKENGKLRLEGKEYLVKDGDVIHFKFNV